MKDFILAALPLVALGIAIAVAVTCGLRAKRAATAAMNSPEDEKPVKKQSDGTHMCLGMCLGLVAGLFCANFSKSWNQGICMTLGMCIGMMPITGIPLPFISFGSSSMMIQLLTVGIVQSIWRHRSGAA